MFVYTNLHFAIQNTVKQSTLVYKRPKSTHYFIHFSPFSKNTLIIFFQKLDNTQKIHNFEGKIKFLHNCHSAYAAIATKFLTAFFGGFELKL